MARARISGMRAAGAAGLAVWMAGSAAGQTPTVTYSMRCRSIPSGSQQLLLFQESLEVVVDVSFSPPTGTVISDPSLPPPGTGTVLGLGSVQFDVSSCPPLNGSWALSGPGFQGTTGTT